MMNTQQQQFDPMAQLMELLNYQLKNKQLRQQGDLGGRELDIRENQGGRELDLRWQQMQQQGEQFQTGLGWDREQMGMRNQQFAEEMRQKMLAQVQEQARFDQINPVDMALKQAQTKKYLEPEVDRAKLIADEGLRDRQVEFIQNHLMSGQVPAYDRQRYVDRLNELLQLGPLRPYTAEELKQQQLFGVKPKQ